MSTLKCELVIDGSLVRNLTEMLHLELTPHTWYVGTMPDRLPTDCFIQLPLEEVKAGLRRFISGAKTTPDGDQPKLSYVGGRSDRVRVPAQVLVTEGACMTVSLPWGAPKKVRPDDNIIVPGDARGQLEEAAWVLYDEVTQLFDAYSASVVPSPDDPKTRS